MKNQGRVWSSRYLSVLLLAIFLPSSAAAISITSFRDDIDPVPPGGVLMYSIRVNPFTEGAVGTFCFNPNPECISQTALCIADSPICAGNSFTGYFCSGAANSGANCGVGDPPTPDVSLCVPTSSGICNAGINAGLPCNSNNDCPGNACTCQYAYNEGSYCCTGNPPTPDVNLCIPNQSGFCNGGPNFGQPCTDPHGVPSEQCPPDEGGGGGTNTVVVLEIPAYSTFRSANMGGTSDGTTVTWSVPAEPCSAPGGISGTPQCPVLTAEFDVDPGAPIGSLLESQVIATGPSGLQALANSTTTIGLYDLKKFRIQFPNKIGFDRMNYKSTLSFHPDDILDPRNEPFHFEVESQGLTILDLQLAAGKLVQIRTGKYKFKSREPGLRRVTLQELAPGHFRLTVRASKMELPFLPNDGATLRVTIGSASIEQPVSLIVFQGGKKFVAVD